METKKTTEFRNVFGMNTNMSSNANVRRTYGNGVRRAASTTLLSWQVLSLDRMVISQLFFIQKLWPGKVSDGLVERIGMVLTPIFGYALWLSIF